MAKKGTKTAKQNAKVVTRQQHPGQNPGNRQQHPGQNPGNRQQHPGQNPGSDGEQHQAAVSSPAGTITQPTGQNPGDDGEQHQAAVSSPAGTIPQPTGQNPGSDGEQHTTQKRRRINISVDDPLYKKLQRIKERYRFKNVCEFTVAWLNILAAHIEETERLKRHKEQTPASDYDDIEEMFNELSYWEKTPDGIAPKRGHNKNEI